MPDSDQPSSYAARLLPLTPLLVLALVPWLADRRTASLLTAVVAVAAFAAVLMASVVVDVFAEGGSLRVLVGAGLGTVASATAAATVGGTSETDHGLRVVVGLLVLVAAFMVFLDDLASPAPFLLTAGLVIASVVVASFVRDAIADDEKRKQRADLLIAAGFGASYLPEIDGRVPDRASTDGADIVLSYDQDGSVVVPGYVQLVSGDFCDEVTAGADVYCDADTDAFGNVGDDRVARRLDGGVAVVYSVLDDVVGGVTQAQVNAIESTEAGPLSDLIELMSDVD